MSSGRQAVFPTRMALTTLKHRELGAKKGYDLLKKKSDALMVRLRSLLREIKNTKELVAREMQGASFCISEAVWAAGDFRKRVVDAPQRERALVRVKVRNDNVAGVKLPVFSLLKGAGADVELDTLGLTGGGRAIGAAKDKFTTLLENLVKLGSLQTSFITLDEAVKVTNRRVNALDNVVIPSLAATIAYVTSELDEIEKEEFFRLKKVLKNKIRYAEEEAAEEAAAAAALEVGGGAQAGAGGSVSGAGARPVQPSAVPNAVQPRPIAAAVPPAPVVAAPVVAPAAPVALLPLAPAVESSSVFLSAGASAAVAAAPASSPSGVAGGAPVAPSPFDELEGDAAPPAAASVNPPAIDDDPFGFGEAAGLS